jgi:hypothetical protein
VHFWPDDADAEDPIDPRNDMPVGIVSVPRTLFSGSKLKPECTRNVLTAGEACQSEDEHYDLPPEPFDDMVRSAIDNLPEKQWSELITANDANSNAYNTVAGSLQEMMENYANRGIRVPHRRRHSKRTSKLTINSFATRMPADSAVSLKKGWDDKPEVSFSRNSADPSKIDTIDVKQPCSFICGSLTAGPDGMVQDTLKQTGREEWYEKMIGTSAVLMDHAIATQLSRLGRREEGATVEEVEEDVKENIGSMLDGVLKSQIPGLDETRDLIAQIPGHPSHTVRSGWRVPDRAHGKPHVKMTFVPVPGGELPPDTRSVTFNPGGRARFE